MLLGPSEKSIEGQSLPILLSCFPARVVSSVSPVKGADGHGRDDSECVHLRVAAKVGNIPHGWRATSYTSLLCAAAIHTAHPMFPLCPQFMQIPPFSCLLATDEIAIIEKVSCLIYRIRRMALAPNVVLVNSRENARYMRS